MGTYMQQKSHTKMLIAALVIITAKWEQPRCLATVERINKLWYVSQNGCNLVMKIDKMLLYATT